MRISRRHFIFHDCGLKAADRLVDITDDGFLSLMDDKGNLKADLKVPDSDTGKEIQEKFKNESDLSVRSTMESFLILIMRKCSNVKRL
ncbi:hypothetical protein FSP39_011126 [Pinctada imbricata]|uniref:Translation initiation factor 5A C-terminal domain-containing protein n=1 Tax=Pinctada imbricata TaxID=66713 RepID=A0AA89CC21_PINIB|nr:hypothetical protein FSP39_011126 [Pinctada imbricata]